MKYQIHFRIPENDYAICGNHLASDFAVNPKYVTCKNCLKMIKPVCDFSNNSPCSDCGKIDIHDFYHCNNKYTKGW